MNFSACFSSSDLVRRTKRNGLGGYVRNVNWEYLNLKCCGIVFNILITQPRNLATSQPRNLATSQPRTLLIPQPLHTRSLRNLATSQARSLRSLAISTSQPRDLLVLWWPPFVFFTRYAHAQFVALMWLGFNNERLSLKTRLLK
jgi:hypothetical protein